MLIDLKQQSNVKELQTSHLKINLNKSNLRIYIYIYITRVN